MKYNSFKDVKQVVGVCHPNWRGIKAATYALTPKVFEVPALSSLSEAENVAIEILEGKPKIIILNGYPAGYDFLAEALKTKSPKTRIFFLSHTSFTWYSDRTEEVSWLARMFKAYELGFIEKMGFIKPDVAAYFREQGINAFHVMNRLPKFESFKHELNRDAPAIGVWGSDMWHRNLLNQTIAGLMFKNTFIHMNELSEYFFLDKSRIKKYGVLSHQDYVQILKNMDVNLYVSFTDCFPMTVVESMSYGIPCLVSDTSNIFTWSKYLKENLIVNKIDSPMAIKEKIDWILNHYKDVQIEIVKYLPILNKEIEKTIERFIV